MEFNKSELIQLFSQQPIVWGKYYFVNHFRSSSPKFHTQILNELYTSDNIVIAAPRESAKSTIVAFLSPIHSIAFKKKRYIVIVQSTFSKAVGSLETIKSEFKTNPLFIKDYPIQITKDSEGNSIFRHEDGFETCVICAGREQIGALRGTKFGPYRPDLIILDDVEDDEMVKNPDRRRELLEQFDNVIMLLGERHRTKVFVIGTVLHDDGLIANLMKLQEYNEFKKLFFQGRIETNGIRVSLWSEKWTVEELDKMERFNPNKFAKEIQNNPASGINQVFQKEDFRYWMIIENQYVLFDENNAVIKRGDMEHCKAAIACDLAWEEKKEHDYSVLMPGYLTPESDLLIDDYTFKKGMRPDEMTEILYAMRDKLYGYTHSYIPVGMEKAKLEKVARWFLKKEGVLRNDPLSFKDLMWDGDKKTRIEVKLQPRYAQHMIYHKRGMGDLESELLRFPTATHDDLCDAAQGLCQLLIFPKQRKSETIEDDKFARLRNFAIKTKHRQMSLRRDNFVFGKKTKSVEIPATISILE